MMKKILPTQSPLGFALTAGAVLFALSPRARKTTRRLAVKGTAAVMSMADQMREATAGMKNKGEQQQQFLPGTTEQEFKKASSGKREHSLHAVRDGEQEQNLENVYNMLSDDYIEKEFLRN